MQKFNFVTDGSVVYRLAGNEWYAVHEDDDKVILVDTDCKIGDEELKTPWSDGDYYSKEGENGQAILDYTNNLADTYFENIKYAIMPRTVEAGTSKLENAYMWPMSKEEFEEHKDIGGKIACNSYSFVWTRTFSGIYSNGNRCAWFAYNSGGGLSNSSYYYVSIAYRVAPAFNLKKSSIIRINPDGEIILKPADTDKDNEKEDKREKIKVPVKGGYLVAGRNEDPNYDGIYIVFQSYDGIMIDLVNVETPNSEHKNSINMYSFEDINSEDYTRKAIFSLSEILKKLE